MENMVNQSTATRVISRPPTRLEVLSLVKERVTFFLSHKNT
jgi:hypothetical protein